MVHPVFGNKIIFGMSAIENVIFACLVTLIALAALPPVTVGARWDGIFQSGLLILGSCWTFYVLVSKPRRIPSAVAPIAGLVLFACLQTIPGWHVSVDPSETRRFIIKAIALGLMLAMLLSCISSRTRLLALLHVVIVGAAASASLGLLLKLAPQGLAFLHYQHVNDDSFAQFQNRNHFALLSEMALGPALGLAVFAGLRPLTYLYGLLALVLCSAIVLTTSRGGIISMLGQLAFFSWASAGMAERSSLHRNVYGQSGFWRSTEFIGRRFVLTILFVGFAAWGVLWLGGDPLRRRLQSLPREFSSQNPEYSSPSRFEIWAATGKLIADHPVLGSGLGAYDTAIRRYFPSSNTQLPQYAHNEYLEFLAGGGVVGGALGVWFVLIIIKAVRNCLKHADRFQCSLRYGAVVGLVGAALHSFVDFGLHVTVNAFVCCSLIAIATSSVTLPSNGKQFSTN